MKLHIKLNNKVTKGGLWHDVSLVRKEHNDVIAICTKSFEQWKLYVIEE